MDYYSILGVSKNATHEEIKSAYKKLVKTHHPDRGGDSEYFKKINEAYDTLGNETKRKEYDNPTEQYHFNPSNFDDPRFEDLFSQIFKPRPYGLKNKDLRISVTLNLEDVLSEKDIIANYNLINGQLSTANIKIPAGVEDGEIIRFKGLGDNSVSRIPRGDLLVSVRVNQHKIFDRDGRHLKIIKHINVFDLILGTKIEITTLSKNNISVNVPKGTQPGTILSVSGYGLPCYKTGTTGNLYVIIKGIIPKIDDFQLIERIKEINDAINKVT